MEIVDHLEAKRRLFKEVSEEFSGFLDTDQMDEAEIDDAIEELRPIRMWFHAKKYGDAPGFRQTTIKPPQSKGDPHK